MSRRLLRSSPNAPSLTSALHFDSAVALEMILLGQLYLPLSRKRPSFLVDHYEPLPLPKGRYLIDVSDVSNIFRFFAPSPAQMRHEGASISMCLYEEQREEEEGARSERGRKSIYLFRYNFYLRLLRFSLSISLRSVKAPRT